jgi:hypothetical protein
LNEDDLPDDLETSDRYIAVPHKNDLGLGRRLALTFADREMPDSGEIVAGFFRRRGAYARFKDLVDSPDTDYAAGAVKLISARISS